jgi:hypothetical protein
LFAASGLRRRLAGAQRFRSRVATFALKRWGRGRPYGRGCVWHFFRKKKYLKYDEFLPFLCRPKNRTQALYRYNQDWINIGVVVDSDLPAKHPELLWGWPAEVSPPSQVTDRPNGVSVVVVAHIYYEDTWPDIAGALRGLTIPFDLIVTTVAGRQLRVASG